MPSLAENAFWIEKRDTTSRMSCPADTSSTPRSQVRASRFCIARIPYDTNITYLVSTVMYVLLSTPDN